MVMSDCYFCQNRIKQLLINSDSVFYGLTLIWDVKQLLRPDRQVLPDDTGVARSFCDRGKPNPVGHDLVRADSFRSNQSKDRRISLGEQKVSLVTAPRDTELARVGFAGLVIAQTSTSPIGFDFRGLSVDALPFLDMCSHYLDMVC